MSADAIVKYRDARKRITEAFAGLKLPNVGVEERGLRVNKKGNQNSYYFFYQPSTRSKTEVQLSRKIIVKGSDIRKLDEDAMLQLTAKLLDVAQDAGARVGPQNDEMPYYYYRFNMQQEGLVRFVLDDFDKLEEEAYEKAIADARTRAQRLARLSQVALGPIVAIREIAVPGETPRLNPDFESSSTTGDEVPRKRLVTSKFQEVPVKVELMVRFEVHPNPNSNAKPEVKGRTGD